MASRHRIVIVGGGFAGLSAAKALRGAPAGVLLVDKTNHHLFQPLLYQVAAAALSPRDIARPIREILRDHDNVDVLLQQVVGLVPAERRVRLADGTSLEYDTLVLAPGARHSYFGHDDWERVAPGIKTLQDALRIRQRLLLAFEHAERDALKDRAAIDPADLTFVVIGAGPTGVELAGALAELGGRTMRDSFRHIPPDRIAVHLVEAAGEVLPALHGALGASARRQLEELGVTVHRHTRVTRVDQGGVTCVPAAGGGTGELQLRSRNVLWAAGNQAPAWLGDLGVARDRSGRVSVGPDLSLPGHPEIFVLGDAAHTPDAAGAPLPGVAPVAIQQGRYLARLLRARLAGKQPPPGFRYRDRGTMATIGKARAVAAVAGLRFSGLPAWLLWSGLHVFFLIGFRARVRVMLEWAFWYFSGRLGARLLHNPLDESDEARNRASSTTARS